MKEFEKLNRIGEGTYGIVCECGAGCPPGTGGGWSLGGRVGVQPGRGACWAVGQQGLRLRGGSAVPAPPQ